MSGFLNDSFCLDENDGYLLMWTVGCANNNYLPRPQCPFNVSDEGEFWASMWTAGITSKPFVYNHIEWT